MLDTVKSGITVEPEMDLTRMHFVNGSFKIEDGEFRNLEQDGRVEEDYIMNCISYPFHVSEKEGELQQEFHTMMEQIFKEPEALQYVYLTFVRAILGEQTNHFMYFYGSGKELSSIYNNFLTNNTFFLLCIGSNGKTTILSIIESVFQDGVYSRKLDSRTLKNDTQIRMNFYSSSPLTRFYIIDESSSLNKGTFANLKKIVDGNVTFRKPHTNQSVTFPINGTVFIASNHFTRFDDSGVQRRVLYYNNKSKFNDQNQVTSNIPSILDVMSTNESKCSIFRLFSSYILEYKKGLIPVRPLNVIFSGSDITYKCFVERYFVETNEVTDSISLEYMFEYIKEYMPDGATLVKNKKKMLSELETVGMKLHENTKKFLYFKKR
jgi:hypothetical protein